MKKLIIGLLIISIFLFGCTSTNDTKVSELESKIVDQETTINYLSNRIDSLESGIKVNTDTYIESNCIRIAIAEEELCKSICNTRLYSENKHADTFEETTSANERGQECYDTCSTNKANRLTECNNMFPETQ